MARILNRVVDIAEILSIKAKSRNKFKWDWLKAATNGCPLSSCMCKVDIDGKAKCMICGRFITYRARGKIALVEHYSSTEHIKKSNVIKTNEKLLSSITGKSDINNNT